MSGRGLSQGSYRVFEMESIGKLRNECKPRELRIEVTHDCPLQCLHCSACSSTGDPLQLPPERVVSVINEFVAMGGEKVVITGGEPLVYAGLMRVLWASKASGARPILFTSGITRNGKACRCINAEEMMRLKPLLSRIVFSVYSASKEKHDQITQVDNSLAMTLDAVRMAVSHGIPTDIHFVPMKINYEDLLAVADIGYSQGVQTIRVLRFVPHGRAEDHVEDLLPSVEDYRAFAQVVEATRSRYPGLIHVGAAFDGLITNVSSTCSAATSKIVVTADGLVAPCDGFKNFDNPGNPWNINLKSLWDIYANSPLLRRVRAVKNCQVIGKPNVKTSASWSGCMAQKSLVSGYVTKTEPDPCSSLDSLYLTRLPVRR